MTLGARLWLLPRARPFTTAASCGRVAAGLLEGGRVALLEGLAAHPPEDGPGVREEASR